MHTMPELSERKRRVLKALVAAHVASAQPVSSDAVAKILEMPISPATIRNEMAELEEAGYLYHPHTSAGRLPSEKGYRYFVETLLEERELARDTRMAVRRRFQVKDLDLERWVDLAAEVLATTARNAALVSAPRAYESRLKHLELVCVHDMLALLVVVMADSTLRQLMVPFSEPVTQDEASAIANRLNSLYGGLATAQIAEHSGVVLESSERLVTDSLLRIMRQVDENRYWDLHLDGLNYMLAQPEFERTERIRHILELLADRRSLAQLLVGALGDDRPRVLIGGEDDTTLPLRECSLVIGTYGSAKDVGGVLAVLGPIRMEYDRAISSVRYLALVMNDLLAELYGWKGGSRH